MDKRTEAQRRESFRQVNASCAVEDRVMTTEDLALQERVMCGPITHEGAIAEVCKEYGWKRQRLSERMRNRGGKRPRSRTESSRP
jgi:hypothetical protein